MEKWLRIKVLRLLQLNVSYAIGADKVSCLNNSAVKESKKNLNKLELDARNLEQPLELIGWKRKSDWSDRSEIKVDFFLYIRQIFIYGN